MYKRDGVRGREESPGAMVEAEGSRRPYEGHGGSDSVRGKGAAGTIIQKA